MGSISDTLLAAGCVRLIGTLHGERVQALSGPDAGRYFQATIIENETDSVVIEGDPRGRRMIRFAPAAAPAATSQFEIQTDDGKKWNCLRQDFGGYLTNDYELQEIAPDLDT